MPVDTTAVILDGYVDEPACLGVPPYISPYIRTVAGALIAHGYSVRYHTIDQIRKNPLFAEELNRYTLMVMIAGVTVPGKYLGGTPASLTEIQQIGHLYRGKKKLVGGPIGFGYAAEGGQKAIRQVIAGFDALLTGEPAVALDNYLNGYEPGGVLDYSRTDPWSIAGSGIIEQHPDYPYVMCELETARGCAHGATGGCSFCTEPFYGMPKYRSIGGISSEVSALSRRRCPALPCRTAAGPPRVREQVPGNTRHPDRICWRNSSLPSGRQPRVSGPCTSTIPTRQLLPGTRRRAVRRSVR